VDNYCTNQRRSTELTLEYQQMKWIIDIRRQLLAHGFAAILLGSELLVPVASADGDAIVQTDGDVSYVYSAVAGFGSPGNQPSEP